MPNDKRKALYDAVSQDYDIGTYEEFETKLSDPTSRKAFYDGVGAEYDLGSYDDFETKLGVKKKPSSGPYTPPSKGVEFGSTTAINALPIPSTSKSGSKSVSVNEQPKEFEKRIQNPLMFITNDDGSRSTHKMASAEVDGRQIAFPTIVNINGKLQELPVKEAIDFALRNNEFKEFKTAREAQDYAEGGYKKGTPLEQFSKIPTIQEATAKAAATLKPGNYDMPPAARVVDKSISKIPQIDRVKAYDKATQNIIASIEPKVVQLQDLTAKIQAGEGTEEDLLAAQNLDASIKQDQKKLEIMQRGYEAIGIIQSDLTQQEKEEAMAKYSGAGGFLQEKYDAIAAGTPAVAGMIASAIPMGVRMLGQALPGIPTPAKGLVTEEIVQQTGLSELEESARDLFKTSQRASEALSAKYDQGIIDSFKSGNIASGANQATSKFLESFLPSIAAASTGGAGVLGFAGQKYYGELQDRDDMTEEQKLGLAALNGSLELAFESLGTKAVLSQVLRTIKEGGEETARAATKSFIEKVLRDGFGKFTPLTAPVQEFISEYATSLSQSVADMALDPEKINITFDEVNKQAFEEGIVGAFGGEILAAPTIPAMFKSSKARESADKLNTTLNNIDAELANNPAPEIADVLQDEKVKVTEQINNEILAEQELISKLPPEQQQQLNSVSEQITSLQEQLPTVSDQNKPIVEAKIEELSLQADNILSGAEAAIEQQQVAEETEAELKLAEEERQTLLSELDELKKKLVDQGINVDDLVPSNVESTPIITQAPDYSSKYAVLKDVTKEGIQDPVKASELLKEIDANTSNKTLKNVLPVILGNISKNDVDIAFNNEAMDLAAFYDPASNKIVLGPGTLSLNEDRFQKIVLHEAMHALTERTLAKFKLNYVGGSNNTPKYEIEEKIAADDKSRKFVNDLKDIYERVMQNYSDKPNIWPSGDYYGLKNLSEFVSETFTNKKFQDIIRNEGSLWKKLINAIKEFFGFKSESDVEAVISLVSDYVSTTEDLKGKDEDFQRSKPVGSENNADYQRAIELINRIREIDKNIVNSKKESKFESDENQTKQISSTGEQQGVERSSRNAEAANVARSVRSTSGEDSKISNAEIKKREETALEKYAKDNGIWYDSAIESFGEPQTEGTESLVYLDDDGKNVSKVNTGRYYKTWTDFFDAIDLNNNLFPETPYEVVGFTAARGKFSVIVKQPLIRAERGATREEVKADMAKRGFEQIEFDDYQNKELGITIRDLHGENVLLSPEGNLFYIDPAIFKTEKSEIAFEPKIKAKFEKATELFDKIKSAESGTKKRRLAEERRVFLEENPSIKYIDDNISSITNQLEKQGLITKKGDCP